MDILEKARILRQNIIYGSTSLDDKTASQTPELFDRLNEYGWWKDTLYKSLIDSNVWTPEQYPSGWELI